MFFPAFSNVSLSTSSLLRAPRTDLQSLNADSNWEQNTFDEGFQAFLWSQWGMPESENAIIWCLLLDAVTLTTSFSLSPGIGHCGLFCHTLASGILIKTHNATQ